jgi:hypothetical protein
MRKILILCAAAILVESLWAADPLIGTWKLNTTKSKFSPEFLAMEQNAAPTDSMMVIREVQAGQIEISETGKRTDGSTFSQVFSQPKAGGAVSGLSSQGVSFIHTVINDKERVGTILQNGKQTQIIHWVVSPDGKTLNSTRRARDPQGKVVEHQSVYDRQ